MGVFDYLLFLLIGKSFIDVIFIRLNLVYIAFSQLGSFIIILFVSYLALKAARLKNPLLKIIAGIIYSSIITYFLIRESYYMTNGFPFGSANIIIMWPIYFLVSIPLLIVFITSFLKTKSHTQKLFLVLMLLPIICGVIFLGTVTFTGTKIFEPIYQKKNTQLKNEIDIRPKKVKYEGFMSVSDPTVTNVSRFRPVVTGAIEILNEADLPLRLTILSTDPVLGLGYPAYCDNSSTSPLKRGTQTVTFRCLFLGIYEELTNKFNPKAIRYIFYIEEARNLNVRLEKTYSINDFEEVVNFR